MWDSYSLEGTEKSPQGEAQAGWDGERGLTPTHSQPTNKLTPLRGLLQENTSAPDPTLLSSQVPSMPHCMGVQGSSSDNE